MKNEKLSVDDLASIDGPEANDVDEDPKDKTPDLNRGNEEEKIFDDKNQERRKEKD